MKAKNRITVSISDRTFAILNRLSSHTHKTKAELMRTIIEEYLEQNPDRFRLATDVNIERTANIAVSPNSKKLRT